MALYPSLEDMKVDKLIKAQLGSDIQEEVNSYTPSAPKLSALVDDGIYTKYPCLNEYMGLELTKDVIAANMPEYLDSPMNMQLASRSDTSVDLCNKFEGIVAPLSGESVGMHRAKVTNGIREVILCKDGDGKVGIRTQSINNGIFVNLVTKNSPASMAGVRFGDQILEINGKSVAGYSMDSVHDIIKNASPKGITFVIRDRPFERTITLHKGSTGHVGFSFHDGKIVGLVVDSSAAKNGLLTDHHLLEVNGQNVVGLKDREVSKIITEGGDIITVTVVPSFIYTLMTKRMSPSLLKNMMDRSVPVF